MIVLNEYAIDAMGGEGALRIYFGKPAARIAETTGFDEVNGVWTA